jgi:hypothetical protein
MRPLAGAAHCLGASSLVTCPHCHASAAASGPCPSCGASLTHDSGLIVGGPRLDADETRISVPIGSMPLPDASSGGRPTEAYPALTGATSAAGSGVTGVAGPPRDTTGPLTPGQNFGDHGLRHRALDG